MTRRLMVTYALLGLLCLVVLLFTRPKPGPQYSLIVWGATVGLFGLALAVNYAGMTDYLVRHARGSRWAPAKNTRIQSALVSVPGYRVLGAVTFVFGLCFAIYVHSASDL